MRVWVYTFCWNEERILPFFLRHYKYLLRADRVVIHDNESTDGSLAEIAKWRGQGVEARGYATGGTHSELGAMVRIRNECWHEARGKADWVIIVDCDELLHHHDFEGFLRRAASRDYSLVRPYGFEMVSKAFPRDDGVGQITQLVRTGVQAHLYSKPCLFNPNKVETIDYVHGAHDCKFTGDVKYLPSGSLKLLHYKRMGWDYFYGRVESLRARSDPVDVREGHFQHYRYTREQHWEEFNQMLVHAVDLTT